MAGGVQQRPRDAGNLKKSACGQFLPTAPGKIRHGGPGRCVCPWHEMRLKRGSKFTARWSALARSRAIHRGRPSRNIRPRSTVVIHRRGLRTMPRVALSMIVRNEAGNAAPLPRKRARRGARDRGGGHRLDRRHPGHRAGLRRTRRGDPLGRTISPPPATWPCRACASDWVLSLDADEVLDPAARPRPSRRCCPPRAWPATRSPSATTC